MTAEISISRTKCQSCSKSEE